MIRNRFVQRAEGVTDLELIPTPQKRGNRLPGKPGPNEKDTSSKKRTHAHSN